MNGDDDSGLREPRDGIWRLCLVGLKVPGMTDAEVRSTLRNLKPQRNGLEF